MPGPNSGRVRNYLFAPVVIVLCSVGAGFINSDNAVAATPDDDVSQSMKSFTRIYDLVERNYADPVVADKAIYDGAIPGMLHTLDPHSNFFDPKAYAQMREDQRARYYGLGMTVGPGGDKFDKTVVRYPFNNSPASRAGLRVGDAILEVNDKKTDGMDTTAVVNMIKGPRGTYVQLKIGRAGHDQPLTFNVMRDEIQRPSVAEAFMIRPGIAYVRVENFTDEHTSKELEDDLKGLGEANLKGLILDLRENPGGILNEGIEVAGHFLKKGQIVVSHRGRTQPSKSFTSHTNNGGHDYPIVVLVNRLLGVGGGDRLRARCRTTTAPGFWARPRSARGWCRRVLSAFRPHRTGADHGALLHPQRAADPARLLAQFVLTTTISTRIAMRATRTMSR